MSKESVWIGLDRFGFSPKAKASIIGNMIAESGCRSNNVEDRYKGGDAEYTAAVDNGTYTRADFSTDHGNYYGYGLCQWTWYTRKNGLYDLAKGRGVSIADEHMQLDYMWQELQTSEFSSVLAVLRSDASIREMTEKFMVTFENPDDKSKKAKDYRVGLAEEVYKQFTEHQPTEVVKEPEPDTPETPFWPPRTLCYGMVGADVGLLQSLLTCHGYPVASSGTFDGKTKIRVLQFQADNDLATDGVAGKKTFGALGVRMT